MKKRLMANMQDEEQDENKIESIDSGLQNKNPDKLDLELSSPTPQANQPFTPSVQTKPSLVVPLSALSESDYQNQPAVPARPLNYDKLDQMLNEQLSRNLTSPTPDLNNNYTPSFYDQPFATKQYYGQTKPKKVNIAQELADERNFNCVPSSSPYSDFNQNNYGQTNYNQTNYSQPSYNQTNYNQTPKLWSSQQPAAGTSHPIHIEIQKDKPQTYSNPSLASYSPVSNYERSQSQQSGYQIPIINQNKPTGAPVPPQRQQSLNRSNLSQEREIPVAYEEPTQSKSFKILQKLTADIEEEIEKLKLSEQQHNRAAYRDPLEDKLPAYYGTLNHIEEPRIRSERRIPIQVEENSRRDNYSSAYNPEYHSKNEQTWIYQNHHSSLPSSANSSSLSDGSFWTQPEWVPQVPASKQAQLSTPLRYQGANIPSRTFRLLQMLANEDDW